jgi:hypothetical protein
MIKSGYGSDHVSIERPFNRIVATILPFPRIARGRCDRVSWLAAKLDGFDKQRNF